MHTMLSLPASGGGVAPTFASLPASEDISDIGWSEIVASLPTWAWIVVLFAASLSVLVAWAINAAVNVDHFPDE